MAFAVTAMIGSSCPADSLRARLHGGDAVHLGHHDVHQHDVEIAPPGEHVEGVPAIVGRSDLHAVFLEHGSERKDVAHVVVDDQHLLAFERRVDLVAMQHRLPLRLGEPEDRSVQHQRRLVLQLRLRPDWPQRQPVGEALPVIGNRRAASFMDDHGQMLASADGSTAPARSRRARAASNHRGRCRHSPIPAAA